MSFNPHNHRMRSASLLAHLTHEETETQGGKLLAQGQLRRSGSGGHTLGRLSGHAATPHRDPPHTHTSLFAVFVVLLVVTKISREGDRETPGTNIPRLKDRVEQLLWFSRG